MRLSESKRLFITDKSDNKNSFILQSRSTRRLINKIKKKKKIKPIIRKIKILKATTSLDSPLQNILSTLLDHTTSQNSKPIYEVLEKNLNKFLDFHNDSQKNVQKYQVLIDNISTRVDSYAAMQKTERAYQVLINDISRLLYNYTNTKKTEQVYTVLKNNLSTLLNFYTNTQKTEQFYKESILIRGPKKLAHTELAYRFFYNKLAGKIQTYQLIDTDRGANFELSSNLTTKLVGTSLNIVYVIPIPLLAAITAGAGQVTLKIASNKRKIYKTKNKLDHCIPETNFIKIVSILLAKIHEPDFKHQENIDLFLAPMFRNFWSLFKKRAKENPNRENLNEFWSGCLVEYLKELKCPLLQENFYENVATMVEKNRPKENPMTFFASSDRLKPIISPAIKPVVNNLATNFQQRLLIIYFMQSLLMQLYMQALTQQKSLNSFHAPSPSLGYMPLGFFAATNTLATTATKLCIPFNPVTQTLPYLN